MIGLRLGGLRRPATSARRRFSSSSRCCLVGEQLRQLLVSAVELGLLQLELLERLLRRIVRRDSADGSKASPAGGLAGSRVGARKPEADVEQLPHRARGIGRRIVRGGSWTARLRSVLISFALVNTASPAARLKARLVHQRRDIVLIGQLQAGIVLEAPI